MLPLMYSSTAGGVGSRGRFEDLLSFTFFKAFPIGWAKAFLGIVLMSGVSGEISSYMMPLALISAQILFSTNR